MSNATAAPPPFVGPRPFEFGDRDLFFGRQREAHEISSLLLANKLLLLYAASGAGKTSLFNAGVRPLIEEEMDILPIARFQSPVPPGDPDVANVYTHAVLAGWADPGELGRLTRTTLAEFLADRPRRVAESIGQSMPRLLVFDQFEELFTTHPNRWQQREQFLEQLADASDDDPQLRVLIVMRDDFISRLLGFADAYFGGMKDRYFLEPLRRQAAEMAISGPMTSDGRSFDRSAIEDLVRRLMTTRVDLGDDRTVPVEGEFVEPILLQVVCQTLWASLPPDVTTVTLTHARKYADVGSSLGRFYSDAVREAATGGGVTEKEVRSWVGQKLLTRPGGTRRAVHPGPTSTEGLKNEAVALLDGKILRGEFRAGARWLEITHDSLLGPIEQSNADFAAQESSRPVRRSVVNAIALLILSVAAAILISRAYHEGVPGTVLAIIAGGGAPVVLYMTWESLRQSAKSAGKIAGPKREDIDKLADMVLDQWEAEYNVRKFNHPTRRLTVSWTSANPSLSARWDTLVEAAIGVGAQQGAQPFRWATGPQALAGWDNELPEILEKVPTGWLVVLGGPGYGKSTLMLGLIRDLLTRREDGDPVPVLVPMTSWEPEREGLRAWLERQLPVDYPGLGTMVAGEDGRNSRIAALLADQKIVPILDGLDEMPTGSRVKALSRLNEAFASPARPLRLVMTCRTNEYRNTIGPPGNGWTPLYGAAVVELHTLDPDRVESYLSERDRDPRWAAVVRELEQPSSALAEALNTPLYASLASTIYNPHRDNRRKELPDPAELTMIPSVRAVEEHLLDSFISAVYPDDENAVAERGLSFLADYMTNGVQPTTSLGWWDLKGIAPSWLVPAVVGVICGIGTAIAAATGTHVGAGVGIGFGTGMLIALVIGLSVYHARRRWDLGRVTPQAYDQRYRRRRPGPGMAGGLIGAVAGGLAAGAAGRYHIGHEASLLSGLPESLGIAIGAGVSTEFFGGLIGTLIGSFVAGYLAAVGVGLPAGVINGLGIGLAAALAVEGVGRRRPSRRPKWEAGVGIPGGIVIGLAIGFIAWREAGVVFGVVVGVVLAAITALPFGLRFVEEDLDLVPSPGVALARDASAFRFTALSAGLAAACAGFLGGGMAATFEVGARASIPNILGAGLGIGLASGLVVGLTFGFYYAASPRFLIISWWLALQGKTPWRLMLFLDDAFRRGVLRQSGAVYQFRHMEMQHHLARAKSPSIIASRRGDQ